MSFFLSIVAWGVGWLAVAFILVHCISWMLER